MEIYNLRPVLGKCISKQVFLTILKEVSYNVIKK